VTHGIPQQPAFGDALPPTASEEVLAFLARRRSAPALTIGAPAPSEAELRDLLTISARVPDHGKLAPWRFIVLDTEGKAAYAARLEAIAQGRPDATKLIAKLGKLKAPPLGVAVVSRVVPGDIPDWEQLLSAGAVCTTLTYAATAMGYGANWITDWYSYDDQAKAALGLAPDEKVAGFIFIGTPTEAPLERARPDVAALTSRYGG
jgi:nitroreductase